MATDPLLLQYWIQHHQQCRQTVDKCPQFWMHSYSLNEVIYTQHACHWYHRKLMGHRKRLVSCIASNDP